MKYELVSGFETHIELQTKTKIFCGCTTQFGGEPNTHCCPVCIGLPGTLPVLNREVVRFAIRAGLAVHGEIAEIAKMDRKNYCYPDLSKAYQISQLYAPLIIGGYVELSNGRKIRLHHIHIEEDAGKLIHQHGDTYVDYNRGGVPLIEIVSEPDIRSIDEAKEYVEKLQQVMRYIGVSDCKMQEGSMRCDVNISVRPAGSEAFGTRTEIKNMNSINNIAKAMEYEYDRQVDLIESGGKVVQETLRYDDATGTTSSMRSKEDAHDYRYFRDPDLVTINISRDEVEELRAQLPELPADKCRRYIDELGIPEKDAALLTKYRRISEFFDAAIEGVKSPKTVSNFIIGQMFRRTETEDDKEKFEVHAREDARQRQGRAGIHQRERHGRRRRQRAAGAVPKRDRGQRQGSRGLQGRQGEGAQGAGRQRHEEQPRQGGRTGGGSQDQGADSGRIRKEVCISRPLLV